VRYFLPDWDDRVDPNFDFEFDLQTPDRDPWRDDIYAHEYFGDEQCYDGILVSRSALKEGAKQATVERIGLRGYLRLPRRYELMGDCGAFGYVAEPEPIYETAEVLEFYERVGVTYGVSVDHIIFPAFPDQRDYRYNLTVNNALEFLRLHRKGEYSFTPVGAAQGWDVASYAAAARRLAEAGYDMLAVGGLVRSRTQEILAIARGVTDAVGPSVRIHLLGVARDDIIPDLAQLGIFSFDSASPMRTSWMSATKNYLLGDKYYTAIRVPISKPEEAGAKGKGILERSSTATTYAELQACEAATLAAIRGYGRRTVSLDDAMIAIARYDLELTRKSEVAGSRGHRMDAYRRTLKDRPWAKCPCRVCRDIGIEVVVFRRNDRNRRRGFHNVQEFYKNLRDRERRVRNLPEQASLGL
jgi:hypothetical protein